jgi:hypothetical protein
MKLDFSLRDIFERMAIKPLLPGESVRPGGIAMRGGKACFAGVRGALRSVLNDRNIWARKNEAENGAEYLGQTQHTPDQIKC